LAVDAPGIDRFEQLDLDPALLRALRELGYEKPTPIQARAIPVLLSGKDLLGCAQTGTGKTAAFALPILQRLSRSNTSPNRPSGEGRRPIRALVLAPTRELASQIAAAFRDYGRYTGLRECVIFGGVNQRRQEQDLRRGADVLVATPGRLLDFISQRLIVFSELEVLVLDEADRMLDMGFVRDVKRILSYLPRQRQTLFFSATMPPEIEKLASTILNAPERVAVSPVASTAEKIAQSLYFVNRGDKGALLRHILGRSHPRQQVAGRPRTRAPAIQSGDHSRPGGDRHRRTRDRRRFHFTRGELRASRGGRDLRPPDRQNGAGWRLGRRLLVL
jgi:ATP-dependent RNA helicase RhlE